MELRGRLRSIKIPGYRKLHLLGKRLMAPRGFKIHFIPLYAEQVIYIFTEI